MGLTKQQLEALNDSSFPNNTAGLITPQVLRDYNDAVIGNTVNQDTYTTDSASFSQRIAAGGDINTSSFATTGSNTFVGTQTVTGSIIGDSTINIYSQFPGLSLRGNAVGSGSQYPFAELVLDSEAYSSEGVIGAWVVADPSTSQSVGMGINTYTNVYGYPNPVPVIYGQGSLFGTDDTLIGFPAGKIDLWRNTDLHNNLIVSGTATFSELTGSLGSFSASISNRINNVSGSGGTVNTGSFATTGSNTFTGNQTMNNVIINSTNSGQISFVSGSPLVISNNPAYGIQVNVSSSLNRVLQLQNVGGTITLSGSSTTIQGVDFIPFSASLNSRILAGGGGGGATLGSNTFTGSQIINLSGTGTQGAIQIVGNSSKVETDMYVDGGNYDTFNVLVSASNGLQLRDYDITNNVASPFISVGTDAGNLTIHRNTTISGSVNVSGSIYGATNLITTGSNTFVGNQVINGAVQISSSATYDLDITGAWQATAPSRVSSSAGISTIQQTGLQVVSGSTSTNFFGRGYSVYSLDGNQIILYASGSTSIGGIQTAPIGSSGIGIRSGSVNNAFYYPITFQSALGYTDGRVTISTPLVVSSSIFTTGGVYGANNLITTGSAVLASQAISGGFEFNTKYTTANPYVTQVGGGTTLEISYGDIFNGTKNGNDFIFWLDTNFAGVSVTGSGITNGAITGYNYGSGVEVFITTGTISNGATYTFTGPAQGIVEVTGSLHATKELVVNGAYDTRKAVADANGFYSVDASGLAQAGASIDGGAYAGNNSNGNYINLAATSSQVNSNSGPSPFDKPQIAVTQNNNGRFTQISFQGNNDYTDGTITVHQPLALSSSLTIVSSSAFQQGTGSALLAYNQSTGKVTYTTYQSALPALFDVGAFYSTITQSGSANVSASFIFDNTIPINSINLTSGSRINIPESAYYNFQFSIQAVQGSNSADVAVWLKKNGSNVANTATYVTIPSNHKSLIALNLWDSGSSGDYYEIAYQSDSNNTTYQYIAATGNIPASPSIILTVNQVR